MEDSVFTLFGHYEYLVMPFGFMNVLVVFQWFINKVMHKVVNWNVYIYLDDILIYIRTSQQNVQLHLFYSVFFLGLIVKKDVLQMFVHLWLNILKIFSIPYLCLSNLGHILPWTCQCCLGPGVTWWYLLSLTDSCTGAEIACTILNHVVRVHGMLCDFMNMWFQTMVRSLSANISRCSVISKGTTVSLMSGYHLESNGQSKRPIQDLSQMLKK